MPQKVYFGKLPRDVRERDLERVRTLVICLGLICLTISSAGALSEPFKIIQERIIDIILYCFHIYSFCSW